MDDRTRLELALAGDTSAVHELVAALTPVVQARAARALARRAGTHQVDARQEILDLTQEVFLAMFSDDQRVLRSWKPELGLSLANFVGLIAQRRAASILRSRRPLSSLESLPDEPERADAQLVSSRPEEAADARNLLERLLERLEATLSPQGFLLFVRLYVREETVERVSEDLKLQPNAVHQWKHRLALAARSARDELLAQTTPTRSLEPRPRSGARDAQARSTR